MFLSGFNTQNFFPECVWGGGREGEPDGLLVLYTAKGCTNHNIQGDHSDLRCYFQIEHPKDEKCHVL